MLQYKFNEDLENNFEETSQEIIYPVYFYPSPKNSKTHICSFEYALSHYDPDCETCEKLKEEELSKDISSVLMDDNEKHIIKLLS